MMSLLRSRSRVILWQTLFLLLLLLVVGWFSLSQLVFWSPDTSLRYLLAREFIDNQWRSPAIEYAARFLDPELMHVPYYYIYIVVGEEMFLRIPTLFPFVSSLLMTVIGRLGLVLPPVLGGVACGLATYKLGRLGGVKRADLLLWASVLGTPVLFYSLEFWDHTFLAAFSLWATYFLARGLSGGGWRFVFLAGILAGVSWVERAEYAVFVAALGLSLLLVTRLRLTLAAAFAGGNLLSVLPLSLVQYAWIGHPLGVTYATYLLDYGKPERYPFSPSADIAEPITRTLIVSRLLTYVESRDPITFGATLLCLLGLVLIVFALRMPRWRKRGVLLAGAGLSAAGYLLWLVTVSNTVVTGIIPTAALLPFSLALVASEKQPDGQRVYPFVLIAIFAFVAVLPAIWPGYGGQHWATRYMLPAYPLLVYLAFYAYEHYWERLPHLRRSLTLSFAGLLVLSVLIQVGGVRLLFHKHAYEERVRDQLQALPADVIVTNSPFLASQMSSLDKVFLYVEDGSELETLVPSMWQRDVQTFVVTSLAEIPLEVPQRVGKIEVQEVQPLLYRLQAAPDSADVTER